MILELKQKKIPTPLGPRLEASGDDRERIKTKLSYYFSSQIVQNVLPGNVSISREPTSYELCESLSLST